MTYIPPGLGAERDYILELGQCMRNIAAGNPSHGHAPKQIFQPGRVTLKSEVQEITVAGSMTTPTGPALPSYVAEPMVSISYPDSVENAAAVSSPGKLARMLHAWLLP